MKFGTYQNVNELVGRTSLDLIRALPDLLPDIKTFRFVVYQPTTPLGQRLPHDPAASADVDRIRQIRKLTRFELPFWEAALAAQWATRNIDLFVSEALKHRTGDTLNNLVSMSAEDVRRGAADDKTRDLEENKAIALDSRCTLSNGQEMHLPLMDFRVPTGTDAESALPRIIASITAHRGFLVNSGGSYHYYALAVIPSPDWVQFCAKCLLVAPFTDSRFIAHRLLDGGASLRLSRSITKPHEPRIVRYV